jgi:HSP20 family protein
MSTVPVHTIHEGGITLPFFIEVQRVFNQIRERAYSLFEQKGAVPGRDIDDWLEAERELTWSPPAEIAEVGNEFHIRIAVPGFDQDDIEITVLAGTIIVSAKAEKKRELANCSVYLPGLGARRLFRRLDLPAPADVEKITARLEKGVLAIIVAKAEAPKVTDPSGGRAN